MDGIRLVFNENEEFDYGLNEPFFVKNIHIHNKLFKMLPYTVTGNADYVTDFTGVIGEFIRIMSKKKIREKFNFDDFNASIGRIFENSKDREIILDIIQNVYIDNDTLATFDFRSLNYLKASSKEVKSAHFLYTMFIEKKQEESFDCLIQQLDMNVLHRLVYEALPDFESIDLNFSEGKYLCLLPYVKTKFQEDFDFLLTNLDLSEKYVKRMLEYYNMFYVTQLAVKLNKFEKADYDLVEKIYMTLSWEVTSQTRRSYEYGWQFVHENAKSLFSHAITFEVLAHNNKRKKITYKDIYEENNVYQDLINDIDEFINEYRSKKSNVDFSRFKFDTSQLTDSMLLNKAKELFQVIEYQFYNSTRTEHNKRYYNNLIRFLQTNFGKRRGRSGYSLNITENDIIMFTQVILGQNNGRMRRVALFNEFEKRGLLFDRESKSKIVELYERLNLLEKKSDSGDAQYVRSVL